MIFSFAFLFSLAAFADCSKQVRIAVIDTGFGFEGNGKEAKLCKEGHIDFTHSPSAVTNTKVPIPLDTIGHGTNVVGLIEKYLKNVDYCIIIIKYYDHSWRGTNTVETSIKSFNYVAEIKPDYVNYSSGGTEPYSREKKAILKYLDSGGTLVVAAGNDNNELGVNGQYYPAMYDKRIISAGNLTQDGHRHSQSNYGYLVTRWERGTSITAYGVTESGTSQAAAITTGKIVLENFNKCDINSK